jgi:ribosome-binding factor A
MSQRTERVDELLRQEIGLILAREAKDPRIGFATITEVETTPDLRHARVWVSVIGSESERTETVAALQHAMHFVRRELGTRLRLRRIPELHVRLDDSLERGTRVLHLIQELEAGRIPDASEPEPTLPTPVRRVRQEGDAPAEPDAETDAAGGPGPAGARPSRRRGAPRERAGDRGRPGTPRRGRPR